MTVPFNLPSTVLIKSESDAVPQSQCGVCRNLKVSDSQVIRYRSLVVVGRMAEGLTRDKSRRKTAVST